MPLPAVPALPPFTKNTSPVRPPSEAYPITFRRRTCLSDRDSVQVNMIAFPSRPDGRRSFPTSAGIASRNSGAWNSPQVMLTPGFATKLAHALSTPTEPLPSPLPAQSPIDPAIHGHVGRREYFPEQH